MLRGAIVKQNVLLSFFLLGSLIFGGCTTLKSSGDIPRQLPPDESVIPSGDNLHETHAIVQQYDTDVHIRPKGGAIISVKRIVTVLDKKGRSEGQLVLPYDKFISVKYVRGALYNSLGVRENQISTNDGGDYGATDYDLYDDYRVKYYKLVDYQYPYTVMYQYEIRIDNLLRWPLWHPQDENEYINESHYNLTSPNGFTYSYLEQNMKIKPDTTTTPDGEKLTDWVIRDRPAYKLQDMAPYYKVVPVIQFTAKKFAVGSYAGSFRSWRSFGLWYHRLSDDAKVLPDPLKQKIHQLLSGATTRVDSLRRLYQYLQQNTRYVSIQLGIGGWKPFPATYVYNKGYGDCKALSNYMVAILRYCGFEAYPALVYGGIQKRPVNPDFPSNQFNHVIVYVPNHGNPIWLECTDSHIPFGQLGMFTANRYALVVTEHGGKLVHTPALSYKQNREVQHVDISVDSLGNSVIDVDSRIWGNLQEYVRDRVGVKSSDEQQKWLRKNVHVSDFTLNSYRLSGFDSNHEEGEVRYNLSSDTFASKTGDRLFIPLNRLNRWHYSIEDDLDQKRTQPVDLIFGFSETDTTVIHVPDSYSVESEPKPIHFEKKFGGFSSHIEKDGNRVLYIRTLQLRKHYYSVKEYPELKDFMEHLSTFDKHMLVLNKRKVAMSK